MTAAGAQPFNGKAAAAAALQRAFSNIQLIATASQRRAAAAAAASTAGGAAATDTWQQDHRHLHGYLQAAESQRFSSNPQSAAESCGVPLCEDAQNDTLASQSTTALQQNSELMPNDSIASAPADNGTAAETWASLLPPDKHATAPLSASEVEQHANRAAAADACQTKTGPLSTAACLPFEHGTANISSSSDLTLSHPATEDNAGKPSTAAHVDLKHGTAYTSGNSGLCLSDPAVEDNLGLLPIADAHLKNGTGKVSSRDLHLLRPATENKQLSSVINRLSSRLVLPSSSRQQMSRPSSAGASPGRAPLSPGVLSGGSSRGRASTPGTSTNWHDLSQTRTAQQRFTEQQPSSATRWAIERPMTEYGSQQMLQQQPSEAAKHTSNRFATSLTPLQSSDQQHSQGMGRVAELSRASDASWRFSDQQISTGMSHGKGMLHPAVYPVLMEVGV